MLSAAPVRISGQYWKNKPLTGQVIVSSRNEIKIEYDEEKQDYYIVWEPIIISSGKTRIEALADLRQAAHYGVDTLIDLKINEINKN